MTPLLRFVFSRFARLSLRPALLRLARVAERIWNGPRHTSADRPFFSRFHSRWACVSLTSLCVSLVAATLFFLPLLRLAVRANKIDLEGVARAYPNFTFEQRLAVFRHIRSQAHPQGRDLTFEELIERFTRFLQAPSNGMAPAANFTGNLTTVSVDSGDILSLAQQSNCSPNLDDAPYTVNLTGPVFSYSLASSTAHYELVLHNAAGLTTTPDNYPAGCGDTNVGGASRKIVFPGVTTGNIRVYAGHFYNAIVGYDQIFTVTGQSNDTFQNFTTLDDPNSVIDLATADLNGDGNGDLVSIDDSLTTGGSPVATVFLGRADGTFSAPTEITLPGSFVVSAVIDDFNGDGKKDLIVSTYSFPSGSNPTYYINFLAGNGDGTFQPVQSYTETPPSSVTAITSAPYFGLISADLRGNGHKDLIAATGIILFGNGDGTFTQSATNALSTSASAGGGISVASADFNKDGIPDIAVDNSASIQIFLGNGDGTFRFKSAYATISNFGYLNAQDIDGDGNIDLYSGCGNNGSLGGDQFDYNMGYALMGNGDGTFRGAPYEQFAYTGSNLGSLTGAGSMDAVGVNLNSSFTSYLGDSKGNFTTGPSLTYSPITLSGTQYTVNGIDSYALGDVNGDGFADLVYLGTSFYGPNSVPGIFVATGKGDGTFNTPVFVPAPAFVQAPDIDVNPVISSIHLADMNHDGKLDLIYTYDTNSYNTNKNYFGVAVQLGNGDGTFQATSQLTQLYSGATAPNPGAYQIGLIGDVNSDAYPDMLILSGLSQNAQSFTLQVYLGTGTGTFNAPTTVSGVTPGGVFLSYAPLVLADMNRDGVPDLVALQPDSATGNLQIAIALGNGDGTFKTPNLTTYASQFVVNAGLAVADFNGDGKLDVATMSYLGPPGSGIAFGNGDGTLQTGGTSTAVTPAQLLYVATGGASTVLNLSGDSIPGILNDSIVLINQGAATAAIPTTPTLTVSPSSPSITTAQALTVTVAVSGGTGNPTPTGSVTLTSGGYTSAANTLASGSAVITVPAGSLATGTDKLTATYTPDSNSASTYTSAAGTGSVTVTAAPAPSFALTNSGNITVSPGATTGNASTITVTPSGGFTGAIALTCAIAPTAASDPATCALSPASVTISGTTAGTSTLTLTTTAATTAALDHPDRTRLYAAGGASLACVLLFVLPRTRRRHLRTMLGMIVLIACLSIGIVSCGGGNGSNNGGGGGTSNPGTPAGTYTVTVTGTAGSTTETTAVTLTVN